MRINVTITAVDLKELLAVRFCTNDGHARVELGMKISEQLDVIPEQLRVTQRSASNMRVRAAISASRLRRRAAAHPPSRRSP
ncbi:hypothetical protein PQR02_38915 [Paraburkholderia sediminicola]|uniref:hypothetical protein n=1 Tax=Paraburkholderia sediminicola TaxID=458836 RepID=UPI0038BAF579